MAEQNLCSVCGKVEATTKCDKCGVPLCDSCLIKIDLPDGSLGYQMKGTSISPVRAGVRHYDMCPKCADDVDVDFE